MSSSASLFDRSFALAIGPQRAATSWLDQYLRARGDVCLPRQVKETYFLNRFYEKGPAYYQRHFQPAAAHRLIMEVTTQSFDCPHTPRRAYHLFGPDVLLLCPLRHPVTRSYSLYRHYKRYGLVQGSLRDATQCVPQIITSSDYALHLARWQDIYGGHKISFVFQEDLEQAPDEFVRQVCGALGLSYNPIGFKATRRCNASNQIAYPWMAGLAQRAGEWLRAHHGYGVINCAKAMGLKRLTFGTGEGVGASYSMPTEDYLWLSDQLTAQVEYFEKMTGRTGTAWHTLPHHDQLCTA